MKTRKHNLNAIALGVTLAMGSMSALAAWDNPPPVANPAAPYARGGVAAELGLPIPAIPAAAAYKTKAPSFNREEQLGLCMIESTVSLLAARANDFQCNKATYDLQVEASSASGITTGTLTLGGGLGAGGATLVGTLGPKRDLGTRCSVTTAGSDSEQGGFNLVNGLPFAYFGDHGWSATNEIFNSNAIIQILDTQTGGINQIYREVDIKDFFKRVYNGKSWEFDVGLEDIKKFRVGEPIDPLLGVFMYPVQKWGELSWYTHENGGEGGLWIKKTQIIPRGVGCKITVEAYDLANQSGSFEVGATVKVGVGR